MTRTHAGKAIPFLAATGVFVLTVALWQAIHAQQEHDLRAAIARDAVSAGVTLQERIEPIVQALSRMAHRWNSKGGTPRQLWTADAALYVRQLPGLQAVEWVDASHRVRWVVPEPGDQEPHGLNLASEPRRLAALEEAQRTGQATATAAIDLVHGGKGFLLLVPLNAADGSSQGFLLGVFRISKLVEPVLEHFEDYSISIVEGDEIIYGPLASDLESDSLAQETPIELVGLHWTIRLSPTPLFVSSIPSALPKVVLGSGLLLALLLAFAVDSYQRATLRTRQLAASHDELEMRVAARTQDLTRSKAALMAEEERLRTVLSAVNEAIISIDTQGIIHSFNAAACQLFGCSEQEALGRNVKFLMPSPHREAHDGYLRRYLDTGRKVVLGTDREFMGQRADGSTFPLLLQAQESEYMGQRMFVGVLQDLTRRKATERALAESEAKLRQSLKMEAIGSLAGGVAHDFNNMLSVILGYSQMALDKLEPAHPVRRHVETIRAAGESSAQLTQQLLAFSRKQVLAPVVVDLQAVVSATERFIARIIGDDISSVFLHGGKRTWVKVDRAQLEQALLNLITNARAAMPDGGRLTIETDVVDFDEDYVAAHPEAKPGRYAVLAVSDTGHGMSPETLARVFEPFFTTKGVGEGTGLGLASVHGFVRQSGGHIWVYSEEGQGSTFKIYLPRVQGPMESQLGEGERGVDPRGAETILLVEDQVLVRELAQEILTELGYTVLVASDGNEALQVFNDCEAPIDLLVTDVVMPNMGGRELAERLWKEKPGLRVLFMSGYTANAILTHGILDLGLHFLQKPVAPAVLARKVREVLDEEPKDPADTGSPTPRP